MSTIVGGSGIPCHPEVATGVPRKHQVELNSTSTCPPLAYLQLIGPGKRLEEYCQLLMADIHTEPQTGIIYVE